MQTYKLSELVPGPPPDTAPPSSSSSSDAITEGGRDNALARLAGAMRRHGMDREDIYTALAAHNEKYCEPPLPDDDVRRIARSISKKEPNPQEASGVARPQTDAGNGERFAAAVAGEFCYCPEHREWMFWDGRVWREDMGGLRAMNRAKAVAREMLVEASKLENTKERDALAGWALGTESQRGLAAMVALAKSEPSVHRRITDFDADPWLLNCENGTYNLRTGKLEEHRAGVSCARMAAVRFVPGARHPALDRYLDTVCKDNSPLRDFLARAFGYSLTGDTSAESLFLLIGPGGSGKTTLVESFKNMLGDYACTISSRTLLKLRDSGGGPRNDIAALCGRRLAAASEIAKGEALDQALVKSLTGGERVTARFLHKEFFEFAPQAKFWLAANDAPAVTDDDSGIWRRLNRIQYPPLPEEARDPELKKTLLTDPAARSALLSWAAQGCADWLSRGGGLAGLAVPETVRAATQAYREEGNPLAEFLESTCELGDDKFCRVTSLAEAYTRWCRSAGTRPVKHREFNARLEAAGHTRIARRTGQECVQKVWLGVGLATGNETESETI